MIAKIIDWSIANRFMVLMLTFILVGLGIYAVKQTPLDALPDLSDVQVIIKTTYPGQAPQVVEDQVTYPLTTAMLSVPKAVNVRGYSFFLAIPMFMSSLKMALICTGRGQECWNI